MGLCEDMIDSSKYSWITPRRVSSVVSTKEIFLLLIFINTISALNLRLDSVVIHLS